MGVRRARFKREPGAPVATLAETPAQMQKQSPPTGTAAQPECNAAHPACRLPLQSCDLVHATGLPLTTGPGPLAPAPGATGWGSDWPTAYTCA